eukprot:Seg1608.4 transcript_id=Seg1608.4/GoldUCD/mRNA.D3Y31 product="Ubiquitin-like protein 7" protein_id=Seg1608.4/GoldUCD/D3Y31
MGFIHLRDSRMKLRTRVEGVDLAESVEILKKKAAELTGITATEQKIVYAGRILEDQNSLASYGLTDGVTVYIFQKKNVKKDPEEVVKEKVKLVQLTELLEKAMNNPVYQASVKRVLEDSDAIEQLIVATPALKRDPVALSLLRDPELLLQVAETANVEKIVKEHPALAQAASHVIAAVTEDTNTRQMMPIGNDEPAEMADLEGMDPGLVARAEMIAAQEEGIQERQQQPQQISAAQLAMALSQAGVTSSQPSTSAQTPPHARPQPFQSSPQPQSTTAITSDFFSQAIASALASTPQSSTPSPQQSHNASLQQMRDMGITNDSLSLRALQQTGGNVEAALNLIFEGGLQ